MTVSVESTSNGTGNGNAKASSPTRLYSGSLDGFRSTVLEPVIGNEFPKGSINFVDDILNALNAEERIRDLAILRTHPQLGALAGCPKEHGLHIHPVVNDVREFGDLDPQISTINSLEPRKLYKGAYGKLAAIRHSDIGFEKAPSDFSALRLTLLPPTGGDTLWASDGFHRAAEAGGLGLYEKPRGSPLSVGSELASDHPVVRTNPFAGWKSIFPVGTFPKKVNCLTTRKSENLLNYFYDLIIYGHVLQVRFKWNEPNDIALWDNRSVFHTATFDYDGIGEQSGNCAVGIGEVPYFDPASRLRREDLG
ncbi:hypothetical protein BDW68DRAFT_182342 [Aspergillus falconensis]